MLAWFCLITFPQIRYFNLAELWVHSALTMLFFLAFNTSWDHFSSTFPFNSHSAYGFMRYWISLMYNYYRWYLLNILGLHIYQFPAQPCRRYGQCLNWWPFLMNTVAYCCYRLFKHSLLLFYPFSLFFSVASLPYGYIFSRSAFRFFARSISAVDQAALPFSLQSHSKSPKILNISKIQPRFCPTKISQPFSAYCHIFL